MFAEGGKKVFLYAPIPTYMSWGSKRFIDPFFVRFIYHLPPK